jgi:hypothetical protein
VVRAAAALAALTQADLHVVHAIELPSFHADAEATIPGMDAELEEARRAQREQLRYGIPPTVLVESCEVTLAKPHTAILRRSSERSGHGFRLAPRDPLTSPDTRRTLPEQIAERIPVTCNLEGGRWRR